MIEQYKKNRLINNKGFSLLEVLISVTILAIIIAPMMAVFTSSIQTTSLSQDILDGTYISQSIYEGMIAYEYRTLLQLSDQKQPYDSDGDGENDCFVQVKVYPSGVFTSLTSEPNPSYLHINFIGEETILFGDSGNDDVANRGTMIVASDDITVTNSSTSNTVFVQVGETEVMRFTKKYISCPIVIIANLYGKQADAQSIQLSLAGDITDIVVVEYARSDNYTELVCSELEQNNIYYGINDYSTTLVHAYVQVFDIRDSDKRTGFIEGTFETSIS